MDLSGLQSAISDLKTKVDTLAPTAPSGDDQAAVDALTDEVKAIVSELSTSPAGVAPPATNSSGTDATATVSSPPAGGVGAWTPPPATAPGS